MRISVFIILVTLSVEAYALQVRFIGNAAFEISDGTAVILIDFPYESGAFGYMTFAHTELRQRSEALCLITHGHADHFEPSAVVEIGCAVAGPNEVQALVPKSSSAGDGPVWKFGGAEIRCIPTEHAAIPHCSYFISWHGIRIFVSGDIESLDVVNESGHPFDVLFLPSWLITEVDDLDQMYSDADVIVHHHRADGEILPACPRCITPAQGSTTDLEFMSPDNASERSNEK